MISKSTYLAKTKRHFCFSRLRVVKFFCGRCMDPQTRPAQRLNDTQRRTLNKVTSVNVTNTTNTTRGSLASIRTFSRGSVPRDRHEQAPPVNLLNSTFPSRCSRMMQRDISIPKKPALSVIDSESNEQEQSRI